MTSIYRGEYGLGQARKVLALDYKLADPKVEGIHRRDVAFRYTDKAPDSIDGLKDTFVYASAFQHPDGTFGLDSVAAATGLSHKALKAASSDSLMIWDMQAKHSNVKKGTLVESSMNVVDMVAGIRHLDAADGKLDGVITQAGRQHVEQNCLCPSCKPPSAGRFTAGLETAIAEDNKAGLKTLDPADIPNLVEAASFDAQTARYTYRSEIRQGVGEHNYGQLQRIYEKGLTGQLHPVRLDTLG